MKKKYVPLVIIFLLIAFYLNRTYSRIYNRNLMPDLSAFWTKPITFKNPNFQTNVKYVSLGDSLTVGIGSTDPRKTLVYIIATKLSQRMSVVLINTAVVGATMDDLIETQLGKASVEKPNYVSVFIGTNDLHNLMSPPTFESKMDYIINYLSKNTSAKIIIFNVPYLGSSDLILFPYNIFFDSQVREYNTAISRVAKKYDVKVKDLYTPTKNDFANRPNFYSADKFHPSNDGYIMWGSLFNTEDF